MASDQVNYWDYIRVEDLLSLQVGVDGDEAGLSNDEVTFITVHQVFELWFKLVLRELRSARDLFRADVVAEQELSGATRSLKRATTIFRVAAHHFEVVETLTTRDYLSFRDKLMGASGFQSAQLRQIEIVFGLEEADRVALVAGGSGSGYLEALRGRGGSGSPAFERVQASLKDLPTLRAAIHDWLYRTPIDGCGPGDPDAEARLDGFVERYLAAHAVVIGAARERAEEIAETDDDRRLVAQRYQGETDFAREFLAPGTNEASRRLRRVRCAMIFIETYRELPLLAWPREVLDELIALEQQFVVFRQRHARMVERVIGRRVGTGGSSGVDYLDETAIKYRVYRDLWTVRTLQLARAAAPELEHADFYGFRAGGE